ncbi:MAG: glucosaminidase domain-containing protein, partial [Leuconostoc falkenbergense]
MAKKKRRKSKKKLRQQRLLWLIGGLFALVVVASMVSETVIYQRQQTQSEDADHAQKAAWINQLAPYARELQEKYHVIASISIAQAILESNWNTSTLATQYHNLYGIKADAGQKSVILPTKEYENG